MEAIVQNFSLNSKDQNYHFMPQSKDFMVEEEVVASRNYYCSVIQKDQGIAGLEHIPSFKIAGIIILLKMLNFKIQIVEDLSFEIHWKMAIGKVKFVVVEAGLKISVAEGIHMKERM